jgi:hypothetical protein
MEATPMLTVGALSGLPMPLGRQIQHACPDSLGEIEGVFAQGARKQNGKLLAAVAGGDVGRAQRVALDAARQAGKHGVTRLMAELIIEILEFVRVDQKQREVLLFTLGAAPFVFKYFIEPPAVAQTGEAVGCGHDGEFLFGYRAALQRLREKNDQPNIERTQAKEYRPDRPCLTPPPGIDALHRAASGNNKRIVSGLMIGGEPAHLVRGEFQFI